MKIESYAMDAIYNYSLQDLKELLNLLIPYQNTFPGINEDIENLAYFINYLYPKENKDKRWFSHISTQIRQEIKSHAFLKPFEYFFKEFAWKGESINTLSITPTHQKLIIPDAVVVKDATSFLASQGPFFKEAIDDFSCDINTHLKFIEQELDATGGTLFLRSTGDAFVFVQNTHGISKPAILTHELEHVIDFFNNPKIYDNLVTREVIPVFMELISLEHYGKIYNSKNEAYQRMLYTYSILKERALEFIEKMYMLDIAKEHQNLSDDDLLKQLNEEGYDLEYLIYLVKMPIKDFYYQIPELIAIELYFLYQNDKKRVISILEDISLHGTDSNILDLVASHNIKLTQNIQEFEYHLLSKVKR